MLPPSNSGDIETELQNTPERVGEAFEKWQRAELAREEVEARLHLEFKGGNKELTATEIKAMITSDPKRHQARLDEILVQKKYEVASKTFMALMKRADLRGRAF